MNKYLLMILLIIIFLFFIEDIHARLIFQSYGTLYDWLKKNANKNSFIYSKLDKNDFANKYIPFEAGFNALSINIRHTPAFGRTIEKLFIDIENSQTIDYFEVKYLKINQDIDNYIEEQITIYGFYDNTIDDISKYINELNFTSKDCPNFKKKIKEIFNIPKNISTKYTQYNIVWDVDTYEILIENGMNLISYTSLSLREKDKLKNKIDKIFKNAIECYKNNQEQKVFGKK